MRNRTSFPREVEAHENVWIRLRRGVQLAARLWLPRGAESAPVPAVLEYLPYRKRDGTCARDALTHPYLAGHGYACLRVDIAGNGDSDGLMDDEYTARELDDAVEVIEWVAAQPWCIGRVGMMGISWGGFNSLQVAALAPPALGAVVTLCSTVDRYADDIHYKGGLLLSENLGWGGTMLSYSSRPPDPAVVGERWREMWLERLRHQPFLAAAWLRHPVRDAYWRHGSVCEDFAAIAAPVLAVGGWADAYKNAVPALLEGLSCPRKGIVGPWVHKYPHFAVPHPQIGFLQEALRWWDRWLALAENGVESDPDYRIYLMDEARPQRWYEERPGRWVSEPRWPPAAPAQRRFAMHGGGRLLEAPAAAFEVSVASPHDCGTDGGEYCAIWLGPEMPGDQRRDDAVSACFDGATLAEALEIAGAPVVELELAADRPVAQVAVRLNDVWPDGASTRITYGVLNLCHRDSHEHPRLVVPGERMRIRITLDHIAYRVPEGHVLRVAVSSAYWPLVWPPPAPVALTLHAGALELPLLAGDDRPEPRFGPAEGAAPWDVDTLRAPANIRRAEVDHVSGEVSLVIVDDFGEVRDRAHGLSTGEIGRERWTVHPADPLTARGETHWTQTLARDEWRVRTEARSAMRCDAEWFYLDASVKAYEGGTLVSDRTWEEKLPRGFL